jgi:hypothetical protein
MPRTPLTNSNRFYRNLLTRMDGTVVNLDPPDNATPAERGQAHSAAVLIYNAWATGTITTDELAGEVLRLIEIDVAAGVIPWDVADFSELHSYVDANTYLLDVMGFHTVPEDGSPDILSDVTVRVNEMLTGNGARLSIDDKRGKGSLQRRLDHKNRDIDMRDYMEEMGNQ